MSKAPAMPMYWDAYLADTTHLTTEEHGAYMLLLAAMWRRNGYVPDDDKDNARILGLTPAKWRKIKARLTATISGFNADGDVITQEKLRKTWEITQEKIAKNAENGAKGGRAAARKNNNLAEANATETLQRKPSIPEPEPEPDKKETTNVVLSDAPPAIDEIAQAVSAYNATAARTGWPSVQKLTPQRRAAIKGRLKDAGGVTGWEVALSKAEASSFLRGERGDFRLTFDFLSRQSSFTKLMEGNYDDRDSNNGNDDKNTNRRADTTTRAIAFAGRARRSPREDSF